MSGALRLVVVDAVTDPPLREAVLGLAPTEAQAVYGGVARKSLPAAEADANRVPVAVVVDEVPVGFFVLDRGPGVGGYAPAPGTVGLRAFFVDARHQRRGHGLGALRALPDFVRRHLPGTRAVALTVNVRNLPAVAAYRRAGFQDTGRLFLGGRAGPQHVLVLPLALTSETPP